METPDNSRQGGISDFGDGYKWERSSALHLSRNTVMTLKKKKQ